MTISPSFVAEQISTAVNRINPGRMNRFMAHSERAADCNAAQRQMSSLYQRLRVFLLPPPCALHAKQACHFLLCAIINKIVLKKKEAFSQINAIHTHPETDDLCKYTDGRKSLPGLLCFK